MSLLVFHYFGLIRKPSSFFSLLRPLSTLASSSSSSSSSSHRLVSVITDDNDQTNKSNMLFLQKVSFILYCKKNKIIKKEKDRLIQLFSTTTPPRLPHFFPTKTKDNYGYDSDICNGLLYLLYKYRLVDYAGEFLDEILDDVYVVDGDTREIVFDEFVKRIRPGEPVNKEYMFEVVDKFCRGCPPTDIICSMVNKLSRSGHANIALEFVRLMDERFRFVPTSVINTLLDGFGRENKLDKMKVVLSDIDNYVQNDFSCIIVDYHHCKSSKNVSEVLQVFQDMMNYKFESREDMFIYNNIIQDLCNVGRQEAGLVLLDMIRSQPSVPKTFAYNNLIGAFCKAGEIGRSRQLFDQMKEDGVRASVAALNALVDGMCKHGMIDSALELFTDVKSKLGLEGNAITYTSLITGLCNLNNLDKAMDLFDEMNSVLRAPPTNTMVYNDLIDSLCKEKKIEHAFSLVDHMIAKGVLPDVQTYNAIFRGLRDMKLLDKAFVVMDTMKEHVCNPDNITMEILTEWLSAEGETARLNKFAKAMGFKFNPLRPVIESRMHKKRDN